MLRPYDPMKTAPSNRHSLRLSEYDYRSPGAYFVTICSKDRVSIFGRIDDGCMTRNEYGDIVAACWSELPNHFPIVRLDSFIVMPNHVHGLIEIVGDFSENVVGAQHAAPLHRNGNR